MRKMYILCLLTLVAAVLDIALFHSGSVSAQDASQMLRVERVPFNNNINLIYVVADAGIIQTTGSSTANARSWCVRGPGGATISP